MGEQLVESCALRVVNLFLRQSAFKNLFDFQLAERFALRTEQDFLTLFAAATHQ
ncbi:hypothetical protein D3C80_1190800 [compost metagenome]